MPSLSRGGRERVGPGRKPWQPNLMGLVPLPVARQAPPRARSRSESPWPRQAAEMLPPRGLHAFGCADRGSSDITAMMPQAAIPVRSCEDQQPRTLCTLETTNLVSSTRTGHPYTHAALCRGPVAHTNAHTVKRTNSLRQKVTREELDFTLGRSRGCIGRVLESAGAAPTAGGRSRRPKGPPCKSPKRGRG